MNAQLRTIGHVIRAGDRSEVEIEKPFTEGVVGIEQFSHLILIVWMHRNDTREKRATLSVHPCGDPTNPLTGVFATRSPARPNPIGLFVTRLHGRDGNRLRIDPIDAFDGTPVVDVKPYIPASDAVVDARMPSWVRR